MNDAFNNDIIPEMMSNGPKPDVQKFNRSGDPDPDGAIELPVGDAWQAVCGVLSFKDVEEVFGGAQPHVVPIPAGVPPAGGPRDAGVGDGGAGDGGYGGGDAGYDGGSPDAGVGPDAGPQ